jgi:phosphatidylglycerophosphate synthase
VLNYKTLKKKYLNSTFREQGYRKVEHIRNVLFHPLATQLTALKITPDALTCMGIVMMLLYLAFISFSPVTAVVCLMLAVAFDSLDGVLARYQRVSSDRGKFIDVMADNFSSFLFALGLAIAQIVHPLIMIAYVYFMLLGKTFKIYLNSFDYQSDWLFRPVAGFIANFINYVSYLLFILYVFVPFHMNGTFFIMTVVLMLYSACHFIRIVRMRPKS